MFGTGNPFGNFANLYTVPTFDFGKFMTYFTVPTLVPTLTPIKPVTVPSTIIPTVPSIPSVPSTIIPTIPTIPTIPAGSNPQNTQSFIDGLVAQKDSVCAPTNTLCLYYFNATIAFWRAFIPI